MANLVKDINTAPPQTPGSLTEGFTPVGEILFFYADDGAHGKELWKTDGVPGSATLVADIRSGSKGADLTRHAIEYNGLLYFSANDGTSGEELWSSDGTPEGTQRVRDIVPGEGGSAPSGLFKFQEDFFFSSYTPETGTALWRSDGSAEGTEMVLPVAGCCALGRFVTSGDRFFFAAGGALWRSNGTEAGTVQVMSGDFSGLTDVEGTLFFTEGHGDFIQLWKSDGRPEGTVPVRGFEPPHTSEWPPNFASLSGLTNLKGTLFFAFNTGEFGVPNELWVSDGTIEGTSRFADPRTGEPFASVSSLITMDGHLYFNSGTEMWKSDGTEGGTSLVKDLIHSGMANPVEASGTLYFRAFSPLYGQELWKSDGTEDGTGLLKDVLTGSEHSWPGSFRAAGSNLYFTADDGKHGAEPWKSDGSPEGTFLLKDIRNENTESEFASSNPTLLTDIDGELLFVANDGVRGNELWKSDGTEGGTVLRHDLNPGLSRSEISSFVQSGDTLYLARSNSRETIRELWAIGPTSATRLHTATPSINLLIPAVAQLVDVSGTLFFTSDEGNYSFDLWKSDGSIEGTVRVKDFSPTGRGPFPFGLTALGDTLLFSFEGGLWRSDGTEAGTVPIEENSPELTALSLLYTPVIGSQVYFQGTDEEHGSELWTSDGTEEGTDPVLDINPGPEGSTPILLTQVGARFFFITEDETHGHRLWVSDGTEEGTTLLHTLSDIGEHKGIRHLTAAGNTLFFSILDGSGDTQIWKSDGTPPGTSLIDTLDVRSQGDPRHYQPYISVGDGKIVFSAHEEGTGVEVWTSDGTPEGTHLLVDVSPGPADSNPMLMTLVGQTLFFRAEAPGIGVELWGIPASNWEGMSPMDLLEFSSYWNQRESSLLPNSDGAIFRRLNTDSDEVIDANDILEFLGQFRIGNR